MIAQVSPEHATNVFQTLASGGPWALAVFLVLVNIATSYALFKFFTGQMASKDVIIKSFADAMNRRAKADSARTEIEALQFASRPDVHPELKQEANRVLQRLKEDDANQQ
jgi:hypothetical protein